MLVTDLFDAKKKIAVAQRNYLGAIAELRRQGLDLGLQQHNAVGDLVAAATAAQLDSISNLPWLTGLRAAGSVHPTMLEQCRAVTAGQLAVTTRKAQHSSPELVAPFSHLVLAGARIAIATRAIALSCLTTASMVTRTPIDDLADLLDDEIDEAVMVMALRVDPLLICPRLNAIATALNNVGATAPLSLAAAGAQRTTTTMPRRAAA